MRPALARPLGWLGRRLLSPDYPLTAIEVRERSVGVVRLQREQGRLALGSAACLELPEGAVRLSMTEPNLIDPSGFRTTLKAALERAGVLHASRVGLVLPDPVARVALLPAREVQGRKAESEELLRFRLRKSVPFDVREAHVVSVPLGPTPEGPMLMVAAISRPVLEQYEEACASLGLHAGLVELAGIALHDSIVRGRPGADRLLVNWDAGYVSLLLSRGGVLALIRTLAGELAASPEQVAREATATVMYYRERLAGAGLAGAWVRSTVLPAADAAGLLAEPLGLVPEVLDPWAALGAVGQQLEAAQALAGAVACAAGRAA